MIRAEVVADSISPSGIRLTTLQYTAHRYILAELNTHRVISKNARSSRAVPTNKLIYEVRTDPALPVGLAANQPGMQAGEALDEETRSRALEVWRCAARDAAWHAGQMVELGAHKQWVNRILEPYMWVHGVITATEWENFFKLRIHKDAMPEIHELAKAILGAMDGTMPVPLKPGDWHLPYVLEEESLLPIDTRLALSVARCARVSYTPFDGNPSIEKEMERAKLLRTSGHWSPYEHQATPDAALVDGNYANRSEHRNFRGWRQYRAFVDGN